MVTKKKLKEKHIAAPNTAPKRKRVKVRDGQLVAIPLLDDTYALAHVVIAKGSIICALFACRERTPDKLRERVSVMESKQVLTVMELTANRIRDGLWPVIGMREPNYSAEMLDTKGWSATASIACAFFNAYFGLEPWDGMYDPKHWEKSLLPGVPVPPTIRYKRDFEREAAAAAASPTSDDDTESPIVEGPAEIHIEIKYPGDALPSIELLHRRQALERALEAAGAGEVTDAGGGGGIMDIYLQTGDVRRAMPLVTKAIADAEFDEDATVESLHLDDDGDSDEEDE